MMSHQAGLNIRYSSIAARPIANFFLLFLRIFAWFDF